MTENALDSCKQTLFILIYEKSQMFVCLFFLVSSFRSHPDLLN